MGPAPARPYLLDHLVRRAAELTPEGAALRSGGHTCTYAELDRHADAVAAVLQEMGVAVGDRVAVQHDKTLATIAAVYGILRAGAAYVPLDPKAPHLRGATIARDCEVAAVVAGAGHVAGLRAAGGVHAAPRGIVLPDAKPGIEEAGPDGFVDWDGVLACGATPHDRSVNETDLAYVLYTSGSTGKPKGVSITHRNCLAFVEWAHDYCGLAAEDVVTQHAPLHFDLSTFDLYATAMAGATLTVVPETAKLFPVRLSQWLVDERVSVWYSVPMALALLARHGKLEDRDLAALRLVLFAGEVFPPRQLRELMGLVPGARYVNLYGPTETNVCTCWEVQEPPEGDDPLPIGRFCGNQRGFVVDANGDIVTGAGAEGELWVRSPTVARGYWGDAGRTAERFRAPATYRTGDIVRVVDDAEPPCLVLVGRSDHMIKSRGYRIELGEIEAALATHASVTATCAVGVPDELMGNRIVAFCAVDGRVDSAELLQACRVRLPSYMVPERIEVDVMLPSTTNGKVDRGELGRRAATLIGTAEPSMGLR
ncbi:MAG: amino acid adenylation domain-containing protein [Acidimicrobiia bacterium]